MQLLGTLTQEVERTDDNNLPLRVQETVDKGLGVFAVTDIPKGNFVLEYSGELITGPEAQKREVSYSLDQSVGISCTISNGMIKVTVLMPQQTAED